MYCYECKTVVDTDTKADGTPALEEFPGGWIATLKCGHKVGIARGKDSKAKGK
jgi:hypothetical protein